MPISATQARTQAGQHQHRLQRANATSLRTTRRQRSGVPTTPLHLREVSNQRAVELGAAIRQQLDAQRVARDIGELTDELAVALQARNRQPTGAPSMAMNVHGVCNQITFALMLTTVLPPNTVRAASNPFPAMRATDHTFPPPDAIVPAWPPGARAMQPDMEMAVRTDDPLLGDVPAVVHAASDAALATCLHSPRWCGTALWTGAGVTAFWAAAATAGYLLSRDTARQYTLDTARLLPPLHFNASELDPTQPACTSLGAHVNRLWEKDSALQRSRTQLGTLDHLRSNALLVCQQLAEQMASETDPDTPARVIGDLWSTGMDEAGIEVAGRAPLQPTLDAIAALTDRPALTAWLFDASARGANPLFDFSVLPDQLHPDTNIAYLAQSGLGLPDSAWYGAQDKQELLAGYEQHVARTLVLSGADADAATRLAADIVTLERALAAASEPFAVLAIDDSRFYNPVSPAQAQHHTPHLSWDAFFKAQGLATPERFSLGMPGFFERLDALLASTPLDTWKAYLQFHATDSAAPCLSSTFVDTHDAFHGGLLKGRQAAVPRFARVMGIIQQEAGDALGPAYAQVAFSPQNERHVKAITRQLTAALDNRLQQCDWMDDPSRSQALQKMDAMRIDIGRPPTWPRWGYVGTSRDSFLGNVQAVRAHAQRRNTALLGTPVETGHWKLTPQTVDAYQDSALNRIVIPAALLQPPLFDPSADEALNYGGIGAIIGHEMAHGFDRIGTFADAHGNEMDWLSPYSRQQFEARAAQLRDQITQYGDAGGAVDSNLTLDENLSDLGGLAIALQAMRQATAGTPDPMIDGMTREQRFFANNALIWRMISTSERAELERATNNHAPGSVRADVAASNLPAFARAFNCTPGTPMARLPADQVRFL
ncbi:putative endopeptidase [Stenotrophomonas maltophilia]|uniref:M13 family metallopeptidase n=1 Tax=Stenotrophomonas chelatiphaga TaxID=517011 RepID=UPI000F4BF2C4|nr:M13 family metallopeptidase [Stenotrophomonas chelatiphaga]MCS4231477.1 putative endopeptidase [Stenotrophomonas chelatiphaga]ROQ37756.1 putative endopeptidase [Stenotrophomonas maltophilia]